MKIKREIFSEWGTLVSSVVIHGTTLKKLVKKFPDANIEPSGTFTVVRDKLLVIYSKK